jgi:hypothetical protein
MDYIRNDVNSIVSLPIALANLSILPLIGLINVQI